MMVAISIGLSSCSPENSDIISIQARKAIEEMVYAKDRAGICYSIIVSGGMPDNTADVTISHSAVPCERIPDALFIN